MEKRLTNLVFIFNLVLIISLNSCSKKEDNTSNLIDNEYGTEDGRRERIIMEDEGDNYIIGRSDFVKFNNYNELNKLDESTAYEYRYLSDNNELQNSYNGEYCAKYIITTQDESNYLTIWTEIIDGKYYLCKKIDRLVEEEDEKETEIECKPINAYFNTGYITDSFFGDLRLMANGNNESVYLLDGTTLFNALHYNNGTKEEYSAEVWLHKEIPMGHIAMMVRDGFSMEVVSYKGKNSSVGHCTGEEY